MNHEVESFVLHRSFHFYAPVCKNVLDALDQRYQTEPRFSSLQVVQEETTDEECLPRPCTNVASALVHQCPLPSLSHAVHHKCNNSLNAVCE